MASLARVLTRHIHVSARRHALSKFAMPAMSPTMTEGGISQWKKKEGEAFAPGDVLLEIETDKATIDVEAQDDGILAKIIRPDGSKGVPVGTPVAILAEEGDDLSGADSMAKEAEADAPSSKAAKESKSSDPPPEPKKEQSAATSESKSEPKQELPKGDRIFATPIAKKIALEKGIPLSQVKGSGPEGRILRADVEKYKSGSLSPSTTDTAGAPAEYTDTPVSNMRRVIGSRLTQSKQDVPHYYLTLDIDMGRVLQLREVFNKGLAEKEKEGASAAKLSVNDFIVKGVACALADVPEANSAWLGEVIRQYKKADISVAVATPSGLITPIIKDAGGKGLAAISSETKTLAKKARDGKLSPSEYQGGTFTISNLGMFGISHFTAIINPPQSCILAVGSTVSTLVPDSTDEKGFTTKQIMKVTLSSDHRTVDGAVGARWLKSFKGHISCTVLEYTPGFLLFTTVMTSPQSEVFLPGQPIPIPEGSTAELLDGVYRANGVVRASLAGYPNIDQKSIYVRKQRWQTPKPGSVVLGSITRLSPMQAMLSITVVDGIPLPYAEEFTGVIRTQDVRATEKDKIKISECFRGGDVVKGIVLSLGDSRSYFITTARNDLGVVFATSEAGFTTDPVSWQEMRCPKTGKTEKRKCAKPEGL